MKNKKVTFRVKEAEKTAMQSIAKAMGLSFSSYARYCLSNKRPDNQKLLYEINRANVLLVQISQQCQGLGVADIAILKKLTVIESLLRRLK